MDNDLERKKALMTAAGRRLDEMREASEAESARRLGEVIREAEPADTHSVEEFRRALRETDAE